MSLNELSKYHCIICDKNYASYKSMWEHNKKFHPPNEYKCEECMSKFTTKSNLTRHTKSACYKARFKNIEKILENLNKN